MRRQPRRQQRHGDDDPVTVHDPAGDHHHVEVREDLRSADVVDLADGVGSTEDSHQVDQGVVEGDRLGLRLDPTRRDHDWEPLDELAQDLPADAPVADDDAGPQGGRRGPVPEDRLHLAPAAQVLGEVIPIVTETAEVDHLAQPGTGRGGGEGGRTLPIPDGEVPDGQGVHEVVGGLLAVQRPAQALRIADVGVHRSPSAGVVVGMACQRRHVVTLVRQRLSEDGTDEPRRPRYGDPHRAPPQLGVGERRLNTMRHRTQRVGARTPTGSTRCEGSGSEPSRTFTPCTTHSSIAPASRSTPQVPARTPGPARRCLRKVTPPQSPTVKHALRARGSRRLPCGEEAMTLETSRRCGSTTPSAFLKRCGTGHPPSAALLPIEPCQVGDVEGPVGGWWRALLKPSRSQWLAPGA